MLVFLFIRLNLFIFSILKKSTSKIWVFAGAKILLIPELGYKNINNLCINTKI